MVARLASVSQFYLNSVASLVAPAFQRVQICLVKSQYPALVLIELTTLDLKIQNGKVFNVNHILNVNFLLFHTELHSSHFTWKVHHFFFPCLFWLRLDPILQTNNSSICCSNCEWTLTNSLIENRGRVRNTQRGQWVAGRGEGERRPADLLSLRLPSCASVLKISPSALKDK